MMKKIVWLTTVVVLISLWHAAWGEQFHLKNGDAISGELISYEDGTYRVTSKYGILSILAADLTSAIFNAEGGVVTVLTDMKPDANSPDQIRGTVKTIQNGTALIQTEYGAATINALDKVKYFAVNQDALQQVESVVKAGAGQEFRLKSGETVSGEVVSYEEGVYRVRSKYGVLSINAEDVASVVFNTKDGIVTVFTAVAPTAKESDVLRGTVDSFRNEELKILTDYGYVVVNKVEKLKQMIGSGYEMPQPLVDKLPDTAFSASSFWRNDQGCRPANAKFSCISMLSNWSAEILDAHQWLQVDLGSSALIWAIGTKGRRSVQSFQQWVTSYKFSYSLDGIAWRYYQQDGTEVILNGNQDNDSEVRHELPVAIVARYVRFYPVTWNEHITMRVEVYGVPF